MAKLEQVHKELDLIQGVIKRMASNSFKVKAWMMAIIGGVVAISESAIFSDGSKSLSEPAAIFVSLFLVMLVLVFWYLDAFFLQTERRYRNLYQWVVKYRPQTDDYLYDLNTFKRKVSDENHNLTEGLASVLGVMRSRTLLPFYLLPLIFSLGLLAYHFVCFGAVIPVTP
jgi:hypothetical protein